MKREKAKSQNQKVKTTNPRDGGEGSLLLLAEDIAFGLLFVSLALAFSTQVQVHFTLPKLVALRVGTQPF
jgi:hypothetical protein